MKWSHIWYHFLKVNLNLILPYVLNAYIYLNSVNDNLLPIIHTINIHNHKHRSYF